MKGELSVVEFLARFGLAALLGVCIGLERQWRNKRAGLHTDALIAIGAALFTMFDVIVPGDNARIIAGIVTGVGFIGGGVIFRTESNVTGINTAATIWATAAIGALAGFGLYGEAAISAAGVIVLNIVLEKLATVMDVRLRRSGETVYKLSVLCKTGDQPAVGRQILSTVSDTPLSLEAMTRHNADADNIEVRADILAPNPADDKVEELVTRILALPGVVRAEWRTASP